MNYKCYITLQFREDDYFRPVFWANSISDFCNILNNYRGYIFEYALENIILEDKINKAKYKLSDVDIKLINYRLNHEGIINDGVDSMMLEQMD